MSTNSGNNPAFNQGYNATKSNPNTTSPPPSTTDNTVRIQHEHGAEIARREDAARREAEQKKANGGT